MSNVPAVPPSVLSIGGSDPSGGAGIQIDILTLAELRVFPFSVITAVTAQNSSGVQASYPLAPTFVSDQLDSVSEDFQPQAIKLGMIGSEENAKVIANFLKTLDAPVVVDPVLKASDGTALFEETHISRYWDELFPAATVVTPNLSEARAFTGIAVDDLEGMIKVAKAFHESGPSWVLVTGGHLKSKTSPDVLYDGKQLRRFETQRIQTDIRGTGCIFASALAANLAKRSDVPEAAQFAKDFVTKKIKRSVVLGKGRPQSIPWSR